MGSSQSTKWGEGVCGEWIALLILDTDAIHVQLSPATAVAQLQSELRSVRYLCGFVPRLTSVLYRIPCYSPEPGISCTDTYAQFRPLFQLTTYKTRVFLLFFVAHRYITIYEDKDEEISFLSLEAQ